MPRPHPFASLLLLIVGACCLAACASDPPPPPPEPSGARAASARPAEPAPSPPAPPAPSPSPEEPDLWLEGTVVLPPGTPADEELVVLARSRPIFSGVGGGEVRAERAVPDAAGRFRIACAGGARRAQVALEARYCRLEPAEIVELDGGPAPIVLRPTLGARLEGTVVPPEGGEAALADVRVRWTGASMKRAEEIELVGGRFVLDALPAGEVLWVLVESPRHPPLQRDGIVLRPGESRALQLRLRTGVVVAGSVTNADGEPVPNAWIEARSFTPGGEWLGASEATPDADGRFVLPPVPAGRVRVEVAAARFVDEELELGSLEDGARVEDVALRLRRGGSIAGRVRWPDERELWPTIVSVYEGAPSPARLEELMDEVRWIQVLPDGSFVAAGLEEGTYRLVASEARVAGIDHEPASVELRGVATGSDDVELVLSGGSPVRGRVVDDLGEPILRFELVARSDAGLEERHGMQHHEGHFALSGLADGAWTLSADAPGHGASAPVTVELPEGDAQLVLVLERDASLSGVARTPEGEPLPRARVELEWVEDGTKPRHDRADGDGRFSFRALAPGRVRLSASGFQHAAGAALELELAPGEERSGISLRVGARE